MRSRSLSLGARLYHDYEVNKWQRLQDLFNIFIDDDIMDTYYLKFAIEQEMRR
jgi:hypothetical protein